MVVFTTIYLMKDSQGNEASVTVDDSSTNAQVCGLKDKNGLSVYFESEAYGIPIWANCYNIEVKEIRREEDFDTLWSVAK